jgi:hypothetical protein
MPVPAFKAKSGSGIGGKSVPAFSKKSGGVNTVGGSGQRSGFTPHEKISRPSKEKSVPHMAASYPTKSTLTRTTGATPKATKSHSGKAARSVPPFSKKKI